MDVSTLRVLFVEDDPDDYILVKDMLSRFPDMQYDLVWASTFDEASRQMERASYDVCLLDYRLGERCGLELLHGIGAQKGKPPVIFLSGQNDYEIDFSAMKAGASDYLTKDRIDERLLERSIRYAIEQKRTEEELERHRSHLEELVESRTKELIEANAKLKEAERSLLRANDGLQLRIRERTADLEHSNEHLKVEIEERRRAEASLRESEERYRTIFEDSPISLWFEDYSEIRTRIDELKDSGIRDLRGFFRNNPQWVCNCAAKVRLIDINKASLNLFKARSKKDLLKGLPEVLCEEGYESLVELLLAIAEGKKSFEAETVCRTVTGEQIDVLYRWSVVSGHESFVSRALVSILDMTERKRAEKERRRAEAQLRHAQKLEAIGTLAGGIAHDFNNILGAILGFADIARHRLWDREPANELIEEIWHAGLRARDLVKQILTFSRRGNQEKQSMQVSLLLRETLKLLRSALPSTIEIRHSFKISPDEDFIVADPTQIHQVIMNLCTNAGHAMKEEGGELSVGLAVTEFDPRDETRPAELPPGSYLELAVSDTGHGMDPAVLERIFEPYFTTKASGEGTGLGLAVVHGIVKDHGGAITVASEPGTGSTFKVYLPKLKGRRESKPKRSQSLPGGNEAILLVDDENSILKAGKQMLEILGYRVTATGSGINALEIFRKESERFDLVITDYTMPLMTGMELAKELLSIRPDMPVILCTGYSEALTPERVKACGIRKLIPKPLILAEMARDVREAIDGRS